MSDLSPGDSIEGDGGVADRGTAPVREAPFTYEQEWYYANTRAAAGVHKNVRLGYEILGRFRPDLFTEAVRCFVARHDALQMDLVAPEAGCAEATAAAQRLRPLAADEPVVGGQKVTAASSAQFDRYASALFSRDVVTPWRPGERPFTFRLLRHAEDHHAFLATFQNLVFDGRAHDLFTREVWRDYQTLLAGHSPPAQARSFAEAARRQRARHGAGHLEQARASWQGRMEFAAEHRWRRPEAAVATADGVVTAELREPHVAALRAVCVEARATVMQWVVASFAHAVAGLTGQAGLSLWTSMDSRRSDEREVVGMFAGVCPLALRDPGSALDQVLAEVRGQLLDALRYQQLTAGEFMAMRDRVSAGAGPLERDIYLNLRSFPGPYRPVRDSGALRAAADVYPVRRITFTNRAALHLRCNEYQDTVLIDLVFDGQRVGRPLARTILDSLVHDAVGLAARTTISRRNPT